MTLFTLHSSWSLFNNMEERCFDLPPSFNLSPLPELRRYWKHFRFKIWMGVNCHVDLDGVEMNAQIKRVKKVTKRNCAWCFITSFMSFLPSKRLVKDGLMLIKNVDDGRKLLLNLNFIFAIRDRNRRDIHIISLIRDLYLIDCYVFEVKEATESNSNLLCVLQLCRWREG